MPGVGLGVIILNEQNQVLLLLRNEEPSKALSDMHLEGTWTLPAGKVKFGETINQAVTRKVKEETNLDVVSFELVSVADDINQYAHFLTLGVLAKTLDGTIDLGKTEEHIQYGYFDFSDLPKNLCLPSKKIIENYLHKRIYLPESTHNSIDFE